MRNHTLSMNLIRSVCGAMLIVAAILPVRAQKAAGTLANGSIDLRPYADTSHAHVANRSVAIRQENGRTVLAFDERPGGGYTWIPGTELREGDIEFDVRGRDSLQASFVGVAFRMTNDTTFDVVYLRPFNFRAADSTRHAHAVQYVSSPDFPWEKLRAEHPGVYEHPIVPAPDPNGWVHVKVSLRDHRVRVYINNSKEPSLDAPELTSRTGGGFGLFVGDKSSGEFSGLIVRPSK